MDPYAHWVLCSRHADNAAVAAQMERVVTALRDMVLQGAMLCPGQHAVDVGCGDGLVGFGALERVGPQGRVTFVDVSQDLIEHVREKARGLGVEAQCGFVRASAEDLGALPDAGADAVTLRSVLVYVPDKARAFREFARILRPGGRLSFFEPIKGHPATREDPNRFEGYDVTAVRDLVDRVRARLHPLPVEADPTRNFTEADMVRWCEEAGFTHVHADLRLDVGPMQGMPPTWEVFAGLPTHPLMPSIEEAMAEVLDADERARVEACLRPQVEARQGRPRTGMLYMCAVR